MVRNTWNFHPHSNPLLSFSRLLSRTRKNLLDWKQLGLNSLDFEIFLLKIKLVDLSLRMLIPLGLLLMRIFLEQTPLEVFTSLIILFLKKINNLKCAQRARLMWVNNGGLNTSFFHNCARINRHRNFVFSDLRSKWVN